MLRASLPFSCGDIRLTRQATPTAYSRPLAQTTLLHSIPWQLALPTQTVTHQEESTQEHLVIRRYGQPTLKMMLSSRVHELGLTGLDWLHPGPPQGPHRYSPSASDVTCAQNNKVHCVEELMPPREAPLVRLKTMIRRRGMGSATGWMLLGWWTWIIRCGAGSAYLR